MGLHWMLPGPRYLADPLYDVMMGLVSCYAPSRSGQDTGRWKQWELLRRYGEEGAWKGWIKQLPEREKGRGHLNTGQGREQRREE